MRRMYSKQQLEEIAKYLVEHSELSFLEDIAFTGDVSIGGDASVAGDLPVTGDVSVGGDLSVTGDASVGGDLPVVGTITGGEIIENMSGYSFNTGSLDTEATLDYVGVVKTGNKITFVIAGSFTFASTASVGAYKNLGMFVIPADIGAKLYPNIPTDRIGPTPMMISSGVQSSQVHMGFISKYSNTSIVVYFSPQSSITAGTYYFRYEQTFLLSENLIPNP